MGTTVPFWDQADEFGHTNLIVAKPEEGESLARALGPHWVVLMRRHGATVVGTSLQEMSFRSIFSCRNADLQKEAQLLGGVRPMAAAEAVKAGTFNLEPRPIARAWEYWTIRLKRLEDAASQPVQRHA
jgi:HCOMODA/2-hydroxy-3-carboxy-muconic semialdehyde decarboxylase